MANFLISNHESFLKQFHNDLRNVFCPIKKYSSKYIHKNNFNFAFFKKYDIILKFSNNKITISNFKGKFFFRCSLEDIKKIRLYIAEKRFKGFWTCGTRFTRYYLKNYIKARICIKDTENYNRIDLYDEKNLQKNSFYLFPDKKINFEKNIESILDLDWKNPPQELNFMIQKGKYCSRYRMPVLDFGDEKSKTFFYNSKTGVSLTT